MLRRAAAAVFCLLACAALGGAARAAEAPRTARHCLAALGGVRDYRVPGARYDLVIVSPQAPLDRVLHDARRAHPGARILGYLNTMDMNQAAIDHSVELRQHEDWFLHDAQGQRVRVRVAGYSGDRARYGMNVGQPGYQGFLAGKVLEILHAGYDGLHLDNIETDSSYQPVQVAKFISALPVELTAASWPDAEVSLLSSLHRAVAEAGLGGRQLFINQVRSSEPEVSQRYLAQVEGASSESWLDRARPFDGPSGWKSRISHAASVAASGKDLSVLSLVNDLARAECLYVFASYLLATDGVHLYFYLGTAYRPANTVWQDFYDADLGAPSEPMREETGLFVRAFSKGYVAVNPRDREVSWSPPPGYLTLDGAQPPAVLPSRTGLLLRHAAP